MNKAWLKWTSAEAVAAGSASTYHDHTHETFTIGNTHYRSKAYWNVVDTAKMKMHLVHPLLAEPKSVFYMRELRNAVDATAVVLARVFLHRMQCKLGQMEDDTCTWSFVGSAYTVLHARSHTVFVIANSADRANKNNYFLAQFDAFIKGLNECQEGADVVTYLKAYIADNHDIKECHFTKQELKYTPGLVPPAHLTPKPNQGPIVAKPLTIFGKVQT